jgi:N-methylhydantoinase B
MGAGLHKDGPSAKFFPIMASHTPVELFERSTNLLVVEKNLRPDSGGPGRFRGGCGQRITIENHDETPVVFTFWLPRVRHPAQGVFGGAPGAPGRPTLNGRPIEAGRFRLEQGDTAELLTPGGGGYGDPHTRDPRRILDDVIDGYVTMQQAIDQYGVQVDPIAHSIEPTEKRTAGQGLTLRI